MNLSEPFIKRPVMTTLVMVSILFFGLFSYRALPVSDLPDVEYPTIQVSVSYPGANPQTMAATCAVPLEREFMTINGLNVLFSSSRTGSTTLILQFVLNKSMDTAAVDVQAAIDRTLPNLPKNLPYNPTYRKLNPSQTPIIYLAITAPTMTKAELYDYGNTYIGQRLSMIDGISEISTFGAPYAARIQVDPEKLAAKQIGIDDVVDRIKTGNVDLPVGVLYGQTDEFTIEVPAQLTDAEQYNDLVIKTEDGSLVKVSDLGHALNSLKDDKYTMRFYDKEKEAPCIFLAVQTMPGANAVRVTDAIYELLPKIQKELPPSLEYYMAYEKKDIIIQSVNDVKMTLIVAFILVVLIIYVALGKALNTIIPSLALPMSILGTFCVMYVCGFSIDILSLLALTLSIGFLVDDAIVVLENTVRHVQQGEKPFDAALKGAQEISMTIFSMTICLVSVFIPMLFLGGIVGRLFREFAVTIVVAVLISGFISLTLTPLLCSRYISSYKKDQKKGWMERVSDWINEKMLNGYKRSLLFAMKHKIYVLLLGVLCVYGSMHLFVVLPKDFIPNQDEGFIQSFAQSKDGTSPFLMGNYQDKVAKLVNNDPSVELVASATAVQGMLTDNQGLFFTKLVDFKNRKHIDKVIQDLMPQVNSIPGLDVYMSPLPMINLTIGITMKALYQYALTSLKQEDLNKVIPKFLQKMLEKPDVFSQVTSDLQIKQPQFEVTINRDRASDLQVTARQIQDLFGYAYSDNKISTINSSINQYDVIVETLPKFYKDPSVMSSLFIRNLDNKIVPLNQIVDYKESVGPLTVNHINALPAATISFNLAQDVPLSAAVESLDEISKEILPRSVQGVLQGTALVFQQSFNSIYFLFLITIFIIYVILGILYENFIHPITVMTALPPALVGGLLSLYIFGDSLSMFSFVGLMMLIGIVMKNGIMMVDFANTFITEGKNPYDAIVEACFIRFRPIIMTTVSAIMGAVPIALGIGGSSAQTRVPLGITVVGGLIFSQILTLFLTPVVFYYLETLREKTKAFVEKIFKKNPA